MNGPVDVRAVVDRAYTALYVGAEDEAGQALAEEVLQVGTAMAELIKACRQIKDLRNRPSSALARSNAWRKFNSALASAGGTP